MTELNHSSRTKALSCRFKVSTIIACYDMQELIGRNPINKAMSTVVSQSLDALVSTMRLEGKLPSYTNEMALQERLIQMIGIQKENEDEPTPMPAVLLDHMGESDPSFEDAFTEAASAALPDPVVTGRLVEIVAPPAETAPKPPTFSELLEAWPNDALLSSCKGDPTAEAAISLVYANLPASQRNSPLAQSLLASTKKLLAEAANAVQPKE